MKNYEILIEDYLNSEVSYSTGNYFTVENISLFKPTKKQTWSIEKQSIFIKSLLVGVPSHFYVILRKKKPNNEFYILKGSEEFLAIKDFLENNLALNDDVLLKNFNGLKYGDMPSQIKRLFLEVFKDIRTILFSKNSSTLITYFNKVN